MNVDALRRDLESAIEGEVRFDADHARAVFDRRERLPDPAARRRGREVARRRGADGDDLREASMPLDDERRRYVASRSGHWQRRHRRYVEVFQPGARSESCRALGAGRARCRAGRVERGASPARAPLCARHLDGESRHRRRHDGEQLRRRALGALRKDDRSRARAARRALGRIARAFPGRSTGTSSRSCAPPFAGRRLLSRGPPHRPRAREGDRAPVSESAPAGRGLQPRRAGRGLRP